MLTNNKIIFLLHLHWPHINVSHSTELARELVEEMPGIPEAFSNLASLGCGGQHPNNEERDLHRWTKNLFGNRLSQYNLKLDVSLGGLL